MRTLGTSNSVAIRLVARGCCPLRAAWAAIAVVIAVAAVAGSVADAGAACTQYDFSGSNFDKFDVSGDYTTANHVSGKIIFNSRLKPSAGNSFMYNSNLDMGHPTMPFAFRFTDGVNTLSSTDTGIASVDAAFVTDAAEQIVAGRFIVGKRELSVAAGLSGESLGISQHAPGYPVSTVASYSNPKGSGKARSVERGVGKPWSGPVEVPCP